MEHGVLRTVLPNLLVAFGSPVRDAVRLAVSHFSPLSFTLVAVTTREGLPCYILREWVRLELQG